MLLQSTSSSWPSWRRKSLKISLWRKQSASSSSSSSPSFSNLKLSTTLHRHISDAHSLAILGVLLRRGTLAIPLSPAEWIKSNDVILVHVVMISFLSWLLISLVPPLYRLKRHQGLFSSLCAPRLGQPNFQPPSILTFFPLIFPDVYCARCGIEKKIAQVHGKDLVSFWQRCHP